MINLRLFAAMLIAILAAAVPAAVLVPRVMQADGAGPADAAAGSIGQITGLRSRGGGVGDLFSGRVGPATVLLGECPALPCLLEMDVGGQPGYLIVDYPNPRG